MEEQEMAEIWAEYFKQTLTENNTKEKETPQPQTIYGKMTKIPTYEEVIEIVTKLKANKSPGSDKIEAELIKYADEKILQRLHQLITDLENKRNANRLDKSDLVSNL